MQILVLNNMPNKTKGYASRYYIEIAPSVFIGHVNKRIRETLWDYIRGNLGSIGNAVYVNTINNAQGYEILTKNAASTREVIDMDGLTLILKKKEEKLSTNTGWSKAGRYNKRCKFKN